jgi:zinc-binding alcohol dehydrogenase family protein
MPEQHRPSGVRAVFFLVEVATARLDKITDLVNRGKLTPRVGTILTLEQARLAHEMLNGAPHKRGEIVLSSSSGVTLLVTTAIRTDSDSLDHRISSSD